nr:MAG TPA: hypothetical protein [Caudoviricetes sp.]
MKIYQLNRGDIIFEPGVISADEDDYKMVFSRLQYDGMDGMYAKLYLLDENGERLKREGYDMLFNLPCSTEVEPYLHGYILKGGLTLRVATELEA